MWSLGLKIADWLRLKVLIARVIRLGSCDQNSIQNQWLQFIHQWRAPPTSFHTLTHDAEGLFRGSGLLVAPLSGKRVIDPLLGGSGRASMKTSFIIPEVGFSTKLVSSKLWGWRTMEMDRMNIVTGIMEAQAVTLALLQMKWGWRHFVAHWVSHAIDGPSVEAFLGSVIFGEGHIERLRSLEQHARLGIPMGRDRRRSYTFQEMQRSIVVFLLITDGGRRFQSVTVQFEFPSKRREFGWG
jgi:hypothetical protein